MLDSLVCNSPFEGYMMLVIASVLMALNFSVQKFFQRETGGTNRDAFKFNLYSGIISAVLFYCLGGFHLEFSWFSLVMSFIITILCVTYTVLGFTIFRTEPVSRYTMFLMIGGMALPYIWGLIFLGEPFSVIRTVGLAVLAFAIFITNFGKQKISSKALLLCMIVFVVNGFVSIASKEHQIYPSQGFTSMLSSWLGMTPDPAVGANTFVVYNSIAKIVVSLVALSFFPKSEKATDENEQISPAPVSAESDRASKKSASLRSFALIVISSLINGVSYILMLIPAEYLPATVVYPFNTGGSIILTAIAGFIFFHEKPKPRYVLGLVLCLVGTCLFI